MELRIDFGRKESRFATILGPLGVLKEPISAAPAAGLVVGSLIVFDQNVAARFGLEQAEIRRITRFVKRSEISVLPKRVGSAASQQTSPAANQQQPQ
jgi:hypothetical protein